MRTRVTAVIGAHVVSLLAGCGASVATGSVTSPSAVTATSTTSSTTAPPTAAPPGVPTRWTSAEYSTSLKSVADGARAADVVAVVVVRGAKYARDDREIPLTYQTVVLERVLGGRHPHPQGTTLTVVQTGGLFDGEFVDDRSDPVLPTGYRVLLFLKNTSPGRYASLDGPYGRYEIDARDVLTPFVDRLGLGSSGMRFHGTLDELSAQVAAA